MNPDLNTRGGAACRLLWPALALLVASLSFAQSESEQQTPAGQQGPGATGTQATDEDVPIQSLTGPLEILVNPVYPPDQARLVYQPLLDYLNQTTGLDVTLVVDRNFHRYWLNARRNEAPPLILEDAHMVAWRMNNFDYQPLVTTAKPITFSLLTTGAMADDSLDDFVGRRISSLPSPSLGYLVLADWFANPLQQPRIQSTATSWLDAVEMVFSAEADAAIAPDNLVARYPNLYPVETSTEFPGLTLSASPDVPDDVRRMLIDAMTVLHDDEDHHAALFELDIDRFVAADPELYAGMEQWLSTIFSF
ncbi:MAG: PhnD/SsuA/transferrin family substrate-binding protein [Wenzhouxiangellaceae bacterium]|nr:PhnD/SsuA/transferrin family substrate-binding protein [Wenzhouxiangellaceae bacterium]MBS3747586.1 PhnD/SsuA/transferrin family substrate-binding protein [Wenzhouxiangellaceae bacterium]MBS3823422.1 PhnD/SsuA/transferrin family substrate-binding protein [Wenzhouxiangellaceae bacterium]